MTAEPHDTTSGAGPDGADGAPLWSPTSLSGSPTPEAFVPADAVVDELGACGLTHVFTVPDYVTLAVHSLLVAGRLPGVLVVVCGAEDEAVAASAGAWLGGAEPMVIFQNQGLHASMNNVRAVGIDAGFPLLMLIGQLGREEDNLGKDPSRSRRFVVRATERFLDACDIPYFRLDSVDDLPAIQEAHRITRWRSGPAAVLVGAPCRWSGDEDGGRP